MFVAVCGWVLWRTGPAPVGRLDFFEHSAATWPHTVLAPVSQYVLRVPWGQLAYRLLPAHSITSYLAQQLGCLALSGVLLGAWLCRRLGMRPGLIAATVIALTPVTAVLLLTMDYDSFSILTWILLLIALGRNGHWQLGAGLLAGIGDFEQIAVGVAMCCSSRHCPERQDYATMGAPSLSVSCWDG